MFVCKCEAYSLILLLYIFCSSRTLWSDIFGIIVQEVIILCKKLDFGKRKVRFEQANVARILILDVFNEATRYLGKFNMYSVSVFLECAYNLSSYLISCSLSPKPTICLKDCLLSLYLKASLPELPDEKRRRYERMGLSMQDVIILANDSDVISE
jgi:hypothetical protein